MLLKTIPSIRTLRKLHRHHQNHRYLSTTHSVTWGDAEFLLDNADLLENDFQTWKQYHKQVDLSQRDEMFGKILVRAIKWRQLHLVEYMMREDTYDFLQNSCDAPMLLNEDFNREIHSVGMKYFPATFSAIQFLNSKYYADSLASFRDAGITGLPECILSLKSHAAQKSTGANIEDL